MKFARLYLKAYGPFRDRVIDLPTGGGKDLHLVFGPNEAGKSTILRAVTAFLFGFPERTNDAFLHDYNALRVGATLLLPNGDQLSGMRRKARKATLFPIDGATGSEITERPLEERTISDILGGLDQMLYQHLFGLDLNGLVDGSQELLRGEGEVGRSLFQAAAGLGSLRSLIAGLDDEATAIFKPRGSTSRLNRALGEYDDQRRILKDATVRSYAWETAEREHGQAEAKHEQLRDTLKEKRAEQKRLERIRANLPLIAERAAKLTELEQLAGIPALQADAGQRRAAAQERLRAALETQVTSKAELARLGIAIDSLVVRKGVLEHATKIEQTYHAISGYRTAREAMPRIAAERTTRAQRIQSLLGEIDPGCSLDQAALLLPAETLVARVQSLIEEHARLNGLDSQLDTQARAKTTILEGLNGRLASLPEPPPVDDLEASLAGVMNAADLETRQRKLDRDVADLGASLLREAAALWGGTVPELIALVAPLPETATHFEGEYAELIQDERLVKEKGISLARDLEERRRELKALAATGEVVTQSEVAAARVDRDEKWSHVRRAYVEQTGPPIASQTGNQPGHPLAREFEDAVGEADRLADLLHADTQRATNLETTRQRIADMQEELKHLDELRQSVVAKRQNFGQRWDALVLPLRRPELTPAALREWLSRRDRVAEKNGDLETLLREREDVATDLGGARSQLDQALRACGTVGCADGESAASALARAQKAVSMARKARADRDSVLEQIKTAEAELRGIQAQRVQVTGKLTEWRLSWSKAAESLKLAGDALPAESKARLDQLTRLSTALNDLAKLNREVGTHGAIAAEFESRAAELANAVQEATNGRELDTVTEMLYVALGQARKEEASLQQLVNDVQRESGVLTQAEASALQAGKQLDELLQQAACASLDDLPNVEVKAARKQLLQQRLVELDEQLVKQNARPIDEVKLESEGFDLDNLGRQLDDVAAQIEDLEGQVDTAQTARFTAKQNFDAIDGGPAAAEAQQALMSLSARIVKEARSYARIRLAGAVLSRVIQAYRDRHQGPLLQRAAEVFARITLASFSGLTIDYEDDRQVLLGVRPDAARVTVAGMSQGTRDQLFLSLRIAAIEQHIEGRGPMPVIVDDLLVQFDDDRAVATLEVLRELSEKTQVLFFTHHRHLVELARSPELTSAIAVHNL